MVFYSSLCHLWLTMVLWHFPGFADVVTVFQIRLFIFAKYRYTTQFRTTVEFAVTEIRRLYKPLKQAEPIIMDDCKVSN